MDTSNGTLAWMADCHRLLDRCITQVKRKEDLGTVCRAFEIIFSLLDQIDAGDDDILFFADEGGSWSLGIDWEKVLPAWFRIYYATSDPGEYAQRVDAILKRHYDYGRGKMLSVARRLRPRHNAKSCQNGDVVRS